LVAPTTATHAHQARTAAPSAQRVFNWQDVPQGITVPVLRASFDLGGYQIYAANGEIIAVPFTNKNLYVLKFGRSDTGQTYFVNEGAYPVLYLKTGDFLSSAVATSAQWYPFTQDFVYVRPLFANPAPTWSAYAGMGWYPGMTITGGRWSYNPQISLAWMPGYTITVDGTTYDSVVLYQRYSLSHPNYVSNQVIYPYSTIRLPGVWGTPLSRSNRLLPPPRPVQPDASATPSVRTPVQDE